jgi:hypothetical protein
MSDELDAWIEDVVVALDLDPAAVDRDLLLDLARDAAHGVTRPAAPLTTFLVGLAAGAHGADRSAVERAVSTVHRLLAER